MHRFRRLDTFPKILVRFSREVRSIKVREEQIYNRSPFPVSYLMDAGKLSATQVHLRTRHLMKTIPTHTRLLAVFVAMTSLLAPAIRAQAEKPAAVTAAAAELELAIKAAKKELVRHSMVGPRNTLVFYTFAAQKAVLVLQIDNTNSTLTATGTLHIFDPKATEEGLSKWVNNQHSDGLFVDPATPAQSLKLPDGTFTVTDRKRVGQEKQPSGDDVLGDYQVKITAKELHVEGKYRLAAFTDGANVFIKEDGA